MHFTNWLMTDLFLFTFQVDRCPTGSGVTARIAVQYAKKQISLNTERTFENCQVHSTFVGKVLIELHLDFCLPFLFDR